MRIGLAGIDGTHPAQFVRLINRESLDSRARIESVYDADEGGLAAFAGEHGIHAASSIEELVERSDAAIIADRRAHSHFAAAAPFLHAGKRAYVDKPLAHSRREAQEFAALASSSRVPVYTASVLPLQRSFRQRILPAIRKLGPLRTVEIRGPGSAHDSFGGVFFYGIHHAELLQAITGNASVSIQCAPPTAGGCVTAVMPLAEKGITATIKIIAGFQGGFQVSAAGEKGTLDEAIVFDEDPYRHGVAAAVRFLQTGEMPRSWVDMVWPIALLDDIHRKAAAVV